MPPISASTLQAERAVNSGETIAFMVDSITQAGNKKGGYESRKHLLRGSIL